MGSSKAEKKAKTTASKHKANKKRKADEITKEPPVDTVPSKSAANLLAGDDEADPSKVSKKMKRDKRSREEENSEKGMEDDHNVPTMLANGHGDGTQNKGAEEDKKAKKRKRSGDQDAMKEGSDDEQTPVAPPNDHKESFEERCKKEKRERKMAKTKKRLDENEEHSEVEKMEIIEDDAPTAAMLVDDPEDRPQKDGKGRRPRKKSKKNPAEHEDKDEAQKLETADDIAPTAAQPEDEDAGPQKNHRFIVFVGMSFLPPPTTLTTTKPTLAGNLPYSATTESIKAYFASVKPLSIRHLTQKNDPNKSKGFAFLEFDGHEKMETCLQKFHHSRFDDGQGGKRKINVELTYVFLVISSFHFILSDLCGV